jgi:hypothetical protein
MTHSLNDIVYNGATYGSEQALTDCPDCKKTGKWTCEAPSGYVVMLDCPRCKGRGDLKQYAYVPSVTRLTIGSVETVIRDGFSETKYMCFETGVGSGTVYKDETLFLTEEAALIYAITLANTANQALDEHSPKRRFEREISSYSIEAAIKAQFGRDAREAIDKYCRLIRSVQEFYDNAFTEEQIEALQNRIFEYDADLAQQMEDYRNG